MTVIVYTICEDGKRSNCTEHYHGVKKIEKVGQNIALTFFRMTGDFTIEFPRQGHEIEVLW